MNHQNLKSGDVLQAGDEEYRVLNNVIDDEPGEILKKGDEYSPTMTKCWKPIPEHMIGSRCPLTDSVEFRRPLPPCRHEGRFDVIAPNGVKTGETLEWAIAWWNRCEPSELYRCHSCSTVLRLKDGELVPVEEEKGIPPLPLSHCIDPETMKLVGEASPSVANDAKAGTPKKVCLCGSSKWPALHMTVMMQETLAGRIVIPMGLYGHADFPPGAKAATNDGDESTAIKQMLDRLHFAKIDAADEILVVRINGYIGNSTQREIEYAKKTKKEVRFYEAEESVIYRNPFGYTIPAESIHGDRAEATWSVVLVSQLQNRCLYLEHRALAAEAKLIAVEKERDTWQRREKEKEKPTFALGRQFETARDQLRLATERADAAENATKEFCEELSRLFGKPILRLGDAAFLLGAQFGEITNLRERVRALEEALRISLPYANHGGLKIEIISEYTALLSTPATATGKEGGK